MPPNPFPTRFSDEQAVIIADLVLSRFEALPIHILVAEIAGLNVREVSEPVAQLIRDLLAAHGHRPETLTWAALAGLVGRRPGKNTSTRVSRMLRAAATAIALGLHREGTGWMLRVILFDAAGMMQGDPAGLFDELVRELDRRVVADQA
jgi:hypothetical protein